MVDGRQLIAGCGWNDPLSASARMIWQKERILNSVTANTGDTRQDKGQDGLLRVAEALPKDVGRGLVRLDPQDLERLRVEIGDVVDKKYPPAAKNYLSCDGEHCSISKEFS